MTDTVKKIEKESSMLLDFIRGGSAQMVVIGHLLGFYHIQQKYNLPIIQNFGVLVFFVLSGFLISQTTFIKGQEYGFKKYLTDRFSRIFYSFIPALILVLLMDLLIMNYGIYNPKFNNSPQNFIGNIFMLQGYPFIKKLGIETFGSGRPFWTVSVEWWLYIFFGFIYYFYNKRNIKYIYLPLFLISVPLVFMYINYRGDGLSIVWLLGFVLAVIYNNINFILSKTVFLLLILAGIVGIALRTIYIRNMYDIGIAIFFLIIIFSILYIPNRIKSIINKPRISRFCKFLASYSYSLYLIHYTLIELYLSFFRDKKLIHFFIIYILCNIISYTFYLFFEKNNHWLKQKITNIYAFK